jgi:hypothetical protein
MLLVCRGSSHGGAGKDDSLLKRLQSSERAAHAGGGPSSVSAGRHVPFGKGLSDPVQTDVWAQLSPDCGNHWREPMSGLSSSEAGFFGAKPTVRWGRWSVAAVAAELRPAGLRCRQRSLRARLDQLALLLGERRVDVKHKRVGVCAQLGDDEWDALGHQARDERHVPAEAVELGHYDRDARLPG